MPIKLGLHLYRTMLTTDNFRFARQAGATHLIVHYTDYFSTPDSLSTASGGSIWGYTDNHDKLWTYEELRDLRAAVNAEGLELAALENFDPAHWYDVLLDGPRKAQQIEGIKQMIRAMGKAGIPVMGYNFSIASVWGRVSGPWARGQAEAVGFLGPDGPAETPIPNGEIWNMVYDRHAPAGTIPPVTPEELWARLADFLHEIVPVAEEAGVRLAAHPDDPPMPTLRGQARLVYQPQLYQRLLDIKPSRSNALEFCLGTLQEMNPALDQTNDPTLPKLSDIYATVEHYVQQDALAYIHFRNVRGKVPHYVEVFLDEGDMDMIRIIRLLHRHNYDGVIIPDHTPQMSCPGPWYAGMAHALGYMKAVVTLVEQGS
jgi:mannonate dehydratase